MAEDNNQENEKKSPVKLILMIVGGIVLLGSGLGLGILVGGGESSDPSTEISQIIEKKENPELSEENKKNEEDEEVAAECAEEEKDAEGNCPVGPKKIPKITPEEEIFATTYYEFPGNFTTNLKESKKFLQISLGVSTQYDDQVMANVDSHQLALRSEILTIMSTFSTEDISGREGKQKLADSLKNGINDVLMKVEGFGGVENVHFTSFVLQ
ncbi:MAG: flagellar biosynthesis protein FliL [Rickettsiales bacterium]|nr:flagellar biosynthesis protein FliL [Rickettsiales bacterium]|tara:strand:+ start:6374 stop:7009 length:636 start_codon:yes stop_codon:yes gene_type:complete